MSLGAPIRASQALVSSDWRDLFTVPDGQFAMISGVPATNVDGVNNVDVSLQWVAPDGTATFLAMNATVQAKAGQSLVAGGLILTEGDKLRARASLDGDAVVSVAGFLAYIGQPPLPVSPAPAFTTLPSFLPASGSASDVFTASDGVASDATSYTRRWLLDGVAIGTDSTIVPGNVGELALEVTAIGPGGIAVFATATLSIAPAGTGWVRNASGDYVRNSSGGKIAAPSE